LDPGQDRGKVIRDCKKKLNASIVIEKKPIEKESPTRMSLIYLNEQQKNLTMIIMHFEIHAQPLKYILMAEMDTSSGGGHKKGPGVKKSKKLSTRIDLTPMVDLGFLLILLESCACIASL
jgi:hypothetical protein